MTPKITTEDGKFKIDWSVAASEKDELVQRVTVAVMTRAGSRKLYPDIGTQLLARLSQGYAFDAIGVQHELNFASADLTRSLTSSAAPGSTSELLTSARLLFSGVSDNNRVLAAINLTTDSLSIGGVVENFQI